MPERVCPHAGPYVSVCCEHLLASLEISLEKVRQFTGTRTSYSWVCGQCADSTPGRMFDICARCLQDLRPGVGDAAAFRGRPEVLSRSTGLAFEHWAISVTNCSVNEVTGITAVVSEGSNRWLAILRNGELVELDLDAGRGRVVATLNAGPQGSFFGEIEYAATVARKQRVAASRPTATTCGTRQLAG